MTPKHPNVTVELTGQNGNAFVILGLCKQAAQEYGLEKTEVDAFIEEATSDDYDHLLQTAIHWFDVQ